MQIGCVRMKVSSGVINSAQSKGHAVRGERVELLTWGVTLQCHGGFLAEFISNHYACVWLHLLVN